MEWNVTVSMYKLLFQRNCIILINLMCMAMNLSSGNLMDHFVVIRFALVLVEAYSKKIYTYGELH